MSPNIAIFAGKYSQGSVAIFPTKRGQYSPIFSYYFHFEKYFRSTDGGPSPAPEYKAKIKLKAHSMSQPCLWSDYGIHWHWG